MQQLLAAGFERLQELETLFAPLVGWLKEWQFLVGSLIAVFAAVITVNAINRQNSGQGLEAKEERRRRVRAFRATMPGDLHAICSYAHRSAEVGREAMQIINASEEESANPNRHETKLRCPVLPCSVPSNLKILIENSDDATAEQIVYLVRCYHDQHGRLAGALENFNRSISSTIPASNNANFNPVFKDTLELYMRAKGMLHYARGESESIAARFEASEVLDAMKVLKIDHVISPEGREYCLRFFSREGPGARAIKNRRQGRILSRRRETN